LTLLDIVIDKNLKYQLTYDKNTAEMCHNKVKFSMRVRNFLKFIVIYFYISVGGNYLCSNEEILHDGRKHVHGSDKVTS